MVKTKSNNTWKNNSCKITNATKTVPLVLHTTIAGLAYVERIKYFFSYIWGNKRDKVSRKQMIKDYRDSGCRMIDIYSYIKALKLTMFRRLLSAKCDWSALFCEICQCNLEKLVKYGDEYPLSCARKSNNIFWKELLKYLNEFMKITEINNTEPRNNHLLYNSSIRINNESIKFNILSENNITFVYDVLNTDGQFLSLNEFEDTFNINICL